MQVVNLTNIIRITLLYILLSPVMTHAITTSQREAAINRTLPSLEKSIQEMMKANGIPGCAIAIVSKDKVYYLKTFGVKRLGKPDKINSSTLFQIASLSKPINATMLAILHDKGKLSLDDPVSDYINNFQVRNNRHPIKICHLASHSTGVPIGGFNDMIEAQAPRQNIVAKLQKVKTIAPPGKQFVYHNAMYGVVEDVITSASGKSLPRTLHEEMFTPLGMKNVCVGYQPLMEATDRAYPHVPNGRGKYVPAPAYSKSYYAFLAAGGINASVQDLVPFMQLYLGKPSPIVTKTTLQKLTTPFVKNPKAVIVHEARKGRVKDTYYGLGWHSMNYAQQKVIYHQGHLKGFRNFMGFLPDDVGIIILTNAEKKHASKIALKFFDLYLNS